MRSKVKVIRNYIPHDICDELNSWVFYAVRNKMMDLGITTPPNTIWNETNKRLPSVKRYTSRMYSDRYDYPELVRSLHDQIEKEFNLSKWHYPVHRHGRDGVVVLATLTGGDVYAHKDPIDFAGKEVLRCNILTSQVQSGGTIYVDGEAFNLNKGDMMQYLVSRHEHRVEPINSVLEDMRIMWMFGWNVDGDEWEQQNLEI
jgi:hypothetical protein